MQNSILKQCSLSVLLVMSLLFRLHSSGDAFRLRQKELYVRSIPQIELFYKLIAFPREKLQRNASPVSFPSIILSAFL